ncbi:CatB-related O-acetyltransferase [Acetobacterium sp.]|jgi:acetyltransferase-like isoleucine patch superfamily enzyme|uniref:CatB-related O-acetyltransferase n=1 Tax=Acetobacterium sp. TaxID=1872094 RepID=UPI00271EA9F9|nr:CatB-related O-acetyltransferase [Acetobacterium sp.]MDO9493756.1 CatB-related O-acetyltransferase [Acetobacterium sp.]
MNNVVMKKISIMTKLAILRKKWRKKNSHNNTSMKNIFSIDKVSVGVKTYGGLCVKTYDNDHEKLIIGSYCSIAGEVKFLLGGEHSYKGLSTFPFKKYVCGIEENTISKGSIKVNDDVWIGENCLILSGVTIGQGAIVAAGSIVAKDIPPYAIYGGSRIIKYRFSEDIIKQLEYLDYSKLNDQKIKDNIGLLSTELSIELLQNEFFKNIVG